MTKSGNQSSSVLHQNTFVQKGERRLLVAAGPPVHGSLFAGMSKQQRVAWHLATPVERQIASMHVRPLPIAGGVGEAPKRSRDNDSASGAPEQK